MFPKLDKAIRLTELYLDGQLDMIDHALEAWDDVLIELNNNKG